MKKSGYFLLKYDDFAEKRTIRPVTPYPGSPLYYDAIESGLLDKNNPAEDFYERKHLNSDLLCCNFTELSDKEFYESLKWANRTLMKNYYDKQRNSTLKMIDHLYDTLDSSFRGFRHHGGKTDASISTEDSFRTSNKKNGKEKLVNWENSLSRDADAARFSQETSNGTNGNKSLKSYDTYLKRKAITAETRKAEKKKPVNPKATSSLYTNWH